MVELLAESFPRLTRIHRRGTVSSRPSRSREVGECFREDRRETFPRLRKIRRKGNGKGEVGKGDARVGKVL